MKIISDILRNISQTKSIHNSTNDKTLSFENQSFVVFQIGVEYENSVSTSPQFQHQKQSKIKDNESDSLPIPWIAAIIINAILVLLFIVFVIYCYCKSKKRRQRIRNPDKDSLFSSKSSKHSVQEVTKSETTKENIFNIESEHKRMTENEISESPVANRKTSIKSPMNKVRTVTRIAGGIRSSHEASADSNHYNPTDSPTVSQFTNQLNDSVPNQSHYRAKHEEGEEGEEEETEREDLEPLTEIEDETYGEVNGDSGYVENIQLKDSDKISVKDAKSSSPVKVRPPSAIKSRPPSSIRNRPINPLMSPSITTASNVMGKVKSFAHSPRKSASPDKRAATPGSTHSSHETAVQTSPNRSWADIPGVVGDIKFDERMVRLTNGTERKYFLYIIKDVNPFTKKECIGRITLPTRQRMTLEQLRYYLLQSEDETIRNCAKRKFKFLSESYRLVVMNESFTPVDQVYQTQGIFIKFNAGESLPFGYKSKNKYRTGNKEENESTYGDRLKPQLESVTKRSRNLSKNPESIYGSTFKSSQRKESIYGSYGSYGSSYGTTPKTYRKIGINDSTSKSIEKSRFGYQKTPNRREETNYTFDRTPRRRDQNEYMTTSPQYISTPMSVSPAVSPRTRMRLCQKIQIKTQVERGQLEKMPSFFTSSLDSTCDNPGCTNKPLLKCLVCTQVNYCGINCKKQHWISDHRFTCKKPPWKGC